MYTQCDIKGTPTWVRLPEDRWPQSWYVFKGGKRIQKHVDPVCLRLPVRARYGQLDAGIYWEQHVGEHLSAVGFIPTMDWKSTFRHPTLDKMRIVYVDVSNLLVLLLILLKVGD